MKKITIRGEQELIKVVEHIMPYLERHKIVCFLGEMGTGKTTLIKVLCHQLGVRDDMSSPTFSIVNEYRDKDDYPIYHFDFYRIEEPQEALDIGVDEYFYSDDLCLIEWPGMINEFIPEKHLEISIKLEGDIGREITISENG